MSISVVCTSCGKKYRLNDELEGKKFRCKGCEQVLIVTESPQPVNTKQTLSADQSRKRRPESSEDQPARRCRKRKKKRVVDSYAHGDNLFGSALDRFDGSYGEDLPDEENPYRAPTHQGSAARGRRRGSGPPPLTMMQKVFSFDRRINRSTYWGIWAVLNCVCGGLSYLIDFETLGHSMFTIIILLFLILAVTWIELAIQIKRWHDRDKSGWCVFINFIPFIGGIWTFIECSCLAGTPGENTYGPEPE